MIVVQPARYISGEPTGVRQVEWAGNYQMYNILIIVVVWYKQALHYTLLTHAPYVVMEKTFLYALLNISNFIIVTKSSL